MTNSLKNIYQEELAKLRVLGAEFSRDNPALAPMLGAKGDDPDVERLLEGVAFLSSLSRQTMAEGFPDLAQSLLRMVFPSALLPTPSATIMAFRPAQGFTEPIRVPVGSTLASIPIDGISAKFTTTTPLTILPAAITQATFEEGRGGEASLTLVINSPVPLSQWLPSSLVIHLVGDYPEASERRRILLRFSREIVVESQGQTLSLGPECLSPWGFEADERALPNQPQLAFNLAQEYFAMPQKLLFLRVRGLGPLGNGQGQSLKLRFRLANLSAPLSVVRPESFLLNACPAVNVFPHPAHPLLVDHKREEYMLLPQDHETEDLEIFSVEEVRALTLDGQTKQYAPFEHFFQEGQGLYRVFRRISPITGRGEHYLSLIYRPGHKPTPETLSVFLKCHNGTVADHLRTGEISMPTDTSPAMASFVNIIPVSRACPPISEDWQLWRLVSHLHVNLMPQLTAVGLREILGLYSGHNDPDQGRALANRKRLEAIEDLSLSLEDYFIKGRSYRGSRVNLTVDPTGFASLGDLDLFGEVLERFFGLFHQINSFSRLTIKAKDSGQTMAWPPRLGSRRLV
ncbi:MAG: type VI secretion system baseplate subunit TssF [Deltaproteobacteria bacterium]|jgi:type VI secretion system protein ImpG|nr:type VI secretion system baseplate subunit TssF [Deltaproteobacteria bacterium]